MTDRIDVKKADGYEFLSIPAIVTKNGIYTNTNVLIEAGDLIIRKMSNGGEQTYKVIDPGFHERMGGFPAHYQMEVINLSRAQFEIEKQQIHYHISGDNNRVLHNSTDNSVNINLASNVQKAFEELKEAVRNIENPEDPELYESSLEAIEQQINREKPNKKIIESMINLLPHAANIATVASLLLSFF
ncbi:hypothetical protein LG204_10325 [Methylovorus menthalis]|uniref:hypothetical protein n=1 Tax=Methylovorus menthalis TaxID=1002227 RepID=UPI001E5F70D8|nr:hypothetical protein [Methylovorus menthalis]MCB4811710.1 hypothetical protein [Methylovorus menthalis]